MQNETFRDTTDCASSLTTVSTPNVQRERFQQTINVAFPPTNVAKAKSSLGASNEALLEMAIADLCHAEGLPFNLGQKSRFRHVLKLARCVGDNFVPPHGNAVGGSLLDLNFKRKEEENLAKLRDGAEVFGLCFLGDGATVKRMPLFNVLGANANTPPVVLEIHDCTKHMEQGGKKDAAYICAIVVDHLESIDAIKT